MKLVSFPFLLISILSIYQSLFNNQEPLTMGSVMFRNRYWFYKSLYDDYIGREARLSFGVSCLLWLPHYWYGIYVNRAMEENNAHKNYFIEWGPRRNRLTHNLIFEQFETVMEDWVKLQKQYEQNGGKLTQNL